MDDGKLRYDIFVKAYNEAREHVGINGLTPSEMFLQRLITSTVPTRTKGQSVTHVGNQKCNLSYVGTTAEYYVNLSGYRFAKRSLFVMRLVPWTVVKNLLNTNKKVIVIMHQKLEHPLADEFRKKFSSLISINLRNREGRNIAR